MTRRVVGFAIFGGVLESLLGVVVRGAIHAQLEET